MSPIPSNTRYLCTCADTCTDGKTRCYGRNHIPSPCHLSRWAVPNAFTAPTSHPPQAVSSDTIHICHSAGVPYSDLLVTAYNDTTYLQDAQHLVCAQKPTMPPPINQNLNSPTYYGPNVHLYSSSNAFEDRHIMSNNNHSSWSTDRSGHGNNVHFSGPEFSQSVPFPSRHEHLQSSAAMHTIPTFSTNGDENHFANVSLPMSTTGTSAHTIRGSSQQDPTLAPAASLDEFDLDATFETPHTNQCAPFVPQDTDFYGQVTTGDNRTTSNTMWESKLPCAGEQWSYSGPNYQAKTPEIVRSSQHGAAHIQLNYELGYSEIDPSFTPSQDPRYHTSSTINPPLPELPTFNDNDLDFLDGIQAFATGSASPTALYRESGSSFVPTFAAQYPDPEDPVLLFSSPPGLTSASTTPSRQQGAKWTQRDTSTDARLVQLRQDGRSYKQIKELLGLEEAESTLRGRYRTLTKPKEARVRKPEWAPQDIDLLFKGVIHCSNSNSIALGSWRDVDANAINQFVNRVPWKQVAEYMEDRGAYRYGNATVKKKYLAVLKQQGAPI